MTNLPLPLQLTKPMLLAGDLDSELQAAYASQYDPKTQLSGGGSDSTTESKDSGLVVVDVKIDDVLG